MRWCLFFAAASLWASFARAPLSPVAAAEPDDPPRERIARLIRDLGDASFRKREIAGEELANLGADTTEQLEIAAQSDDLEVRLRAQRLLQQLREAELWQASRVDVRGSYPADALLDEFARQSGNRILFGDGHGALGQAEVTLSDASRDFWPQIDELCRQSGNRLRQHYDTRNPGLVVYKGQASRCPVAYAGPLRAEITAARRVYIEEVDYDRMASDITHTFQLSMQMMWEDRFKLVAYRAHPLLVEAVTEAGEQLTAVQTSAGGWNVAGSGTRQVSMSLRLQPPAVDARVLRRLSLRWGLIAVGDMNLLEVGDLESREPHVRDNVSLVVERIEKKQGSRYEVSVLVSRDLVIPEPQDILFQENELQLVDAQGRLFQSQGQTSQLTPLGARLKVNFVGDSSESEPARLRLVYPRIRSQHDREITFRDVPLPTGRPN